ncbi:MAG: hypothetical protein KDB80_12405, partial [Planctomycetes bacterium]|nr:hypothetical protein [Planctomycetota bacterium]
MGLGAIILAIWCALTIVVVVVWWLVRRWRKRPRRWLVVAGVVVVWFFAWWLLLVPEGLGYLATSVIGTRHFERGYQGPPVDARGRVVDEDLAV